MALGEKLLNLTLEYQQSVKVREPDPQHDHLGGTPVGREPSAIAAEYVDVLKTLVVGE
ncbi:hypothetical protein [Rhodococcus sp. (in: high G+C Gram-positive bacteria)]|uniref:hypothetical protein n=1 Tax=Rhodococcus sp. TaxID=1831 RepID=UPI00257C300B|nr:hypothetical protein [Rhodococcus sp. (in: high G+C Gram-positive bacteria)]